MTIAIGERYRQKLAEGLSKCGVDVLWLPDNKAVDSRLSGHADLSMYYESGHLFAAEGIAPFVVNLFTSENFNTIRGQGVSYPSDAALCACPVGKYIFCNPKTVSPEIIRSTTRKVLAVHQGYTRCTVCVVSENAIITADKAIAATAARAGLDTLLIEPGNITLDGFDYGFIGGASINISESEIAFTGTLKMHPNAPDILCFLRNHGKTPIFLTNEPIFDIGGGIVLL